MNGPIQLPTTYDYRLVALSVALAILASYTALELAGRVTAGRGRVQLAWLTGGAFAMGSGIWSMHYIGMLAYRLPIPVYYHLPTVGLSLLAGVLASLTALFVVSRERLRAFDVIAGSLIMGGGIAAMHYTGMAAMRLAAMHDYRRGLWWLSVAVAVVVSLVGMTLLAHFRDENRSWKLKTATAVIMGLAIPVMHYTGMAAVRFMPTTTPPDLSHAVDISTLASGGVVVVTLVILGFSVLISLIDRRLSEQTRQLALSRQRYHLLFESNPHPTFVFDRHTFDLLTVNHAACETYGYSAEEFAAMKITALLATSEQDGVLGVGENGDITEAQHLRKDGTAITVEVRLRNVVWDARPAALALANDITERKKTEAALSEAERNYRGIFDEAIIGMFQSTPDGRFLSVNRAMARIFGFDSPAEMIASVHDISQQLYVEPKRYNEFVMVMERIGSMLSLECEVFRKDGSKIWIASSGRAVRQNRVAIRFEGTTEDITERRLLRGQHLQAQKLESVGQLAAGIAHEINTPTQYIGDNVRFLRDAFADITDLLANHERLLAAVRDSPVAQEAAQEIAELAERTNTDYLLEEIPKAIEQSLEGVSQVAGLVSAMKEFSHPGTKEKIPLNLNHAIESTITVSRSEWKYVADMETDFDSSLPMVPCLPGEFNQVILNLIVNAAHAIADSLGKKGEQKGKIRVQTLNFPDWVEIRIEDTGTGIPQHAQARIFDPFFTTKGIGKGTGQGLVIARSVVVNKHGGSISFKTEEGKGTTFIIRLPHDGQTLPTQIQGAHA